MMSVPCDKSSGTIAATNVNEQGVITVQENPNYDGLPKATISNYIRILAHSSKADRCALLLGLVCACGSGTALPLMNIVFGKMVRSFSGYFVPDSQVTKDMFKAAVNRNALYLVYLFIGRFVLTYISLYCFRMAGLRISARLRLSYLKSLFSQSVQKLDMVSSGTVANTITASSNTIQMSISDKLHSLLMAIAVTITAYAIAFSYSWSLTLVSSSSILFVLLVYSISTPILIKMLQAVDKANEKASSVAAEVLASIRTVVSLGAEQTLTQKYFDAVDDAQKHGLALSIHYGIQLSPVFFAIYASFGLAFWFGIKLYLGGDIDDVGSIITVFFSVLIIITIFGTLGPPLIAIAKATSCSSEYFSMIYAPRINYEGISEPDVSPHGDIEFTDVIFSYPTRADVQVLKGFSARFQKGKTTALVGPSGSGKSTIVALLERWYELEKGDNNVGPGSLSEEASTHGQQPTPQDHGSISIGGHDIADVRLRWWRSQIGLVQQEPFLFNDTIFNNICFGLKGTQWDDEDESKKKERGYQTKIGESGIKLSGGQRQRLAIARSIIRQPAILILDEATSSIDVRGERIVQKALEKVSKDLTTIVIAHRLSTIRKADHIIVMRDGRNMEEGTHNYLLSIPGGIYAGFVHAQQLEAECAPTTLTDEMASLQDLDRQHTTTSFKGQEDTTKVAKQMGFFMSVGRLLYEQRAYWKLCVPVVLAAMGAGSSFPLQSWIFAQLVQVFTLTGERLKSRGDFWALMFFVLSLGIAISYLCLGYFSNQFSVYVSTVYRRQYFKNLLQSPISWFDKEDNASGSLMARLATDCKLLAELIGFNGVFPLIAIFNIIGCTAVSFYFGWKLTLVVFFSALPVIIVASFVRLKLEREFEEWNAKVFSQSSQFATEAVGAFRTVISLTMEESIIHKYSELLQLQIREAFRKSAYACLVFALSDSIELCAMALTYWYGGQLLSTYEYNSLQFFVVYIAIVQGAQGAGQFFGFAPNIVAATSAANRILKSREIHDQIEMTPRREGELLQPENKSGAKIKFKDVAFRYPTREVPIYRNLNLNIGSGQFVAFVGPSGCGKTTVISLLERFYNPVSGTITLNDHNIQDIEIRSYRRALSLVAQEPKLFDGTIRDNLVLGLSSGGQPEPPTDDQIFEACISAEIHDFIVSLPEGYATILGINAQSSLSGGQKQRLCLARALLRSPSLLLLDEATSSLDSQSEKLVQQTIEKLVGERCMTVIAVAHRLATIQKADIIFVFGESEAGEGSRILEQGTHRELLGQRGAYWAMCQEQSLDR
ncbi:unnamed protein product [Penicillium viridicatum]